MPSRKQTAAPAGAEHSTLYVAIEISGKSWVVGIKECLNNPGFGGYLGCLVRS